MSKQIVKSPSRISFTPQRGTVEQLDELADDQDTSRADVIREAIRAYLDRNEGQSIGEIHKPDHDELRAAYEELLSLSDSPTGIQTIAVSEAVDRLYSNECPKDAVKRRLLEPLAELGFLTVRSGRIAVHRRSADAVDAVETRADAELDRLSITEPNPYEDAPAEYRELLKYKRASIDPPFGLVAWVADRTVWGEA